MQGDVPEKTLVDARWRIGKVANNVQLAFIQTHGVQGMCETERKERKIGDEKRVFQVQEPWTTCNVAIEFVSRVKSGIMSIVLFPANILLNIHPISSN